MEPGKTKPTWAELLGSNQWEGLLQPLDLSLRKLILRCGDFCQATYDAFISDQHTKFCGSSRYGKKSFFHEVYLPNASNYKVVAFLYATSSIDVPEAFIIHSISPETWDRESNWIGYIAVSTDKVSQALGRREIYVAWRGTIRVLEWADILEAELVSIKPILKANNSSNDSDDDGDNVLKVMKGWLTIYTSNNLNSPFGKTSARTQVLTKIKELVDLYKDEELTLTFVGHSLGAALAVLSALDVVENDTVKIPVAAFVFGCPMLGNKAFCDMLKAVPILHVKNIIDLIPHYPSVLLGYAYLGIELLIDSRKSPSLKSSLKPGDWHN